MNLKEYRGHFFYCERIAKSEILRTTYCELDTGEIVEYTEMNSKDKIPIAEDSIYLGTGKFHSSVQNRVKLYAPFWNRVGGNKFEKMLKNLLVDRKAQQAAMIDRQMIEAVLKSIDEMRMVKAQICQFCFNPQHVERKLNDFPIVFCLQAPSRYVRLAAKTTCKCCKCANRDFPDDPFRTMDYK